MCRGRSQGRRASPCPHAARAPPRAPARSRHAYRPRRRGGVPPPGTRPPERACRGALERHLQHNVARRRRPDPTVVVGLVHRALEERRPVAEAELAHSEEARSPEHAVVDPHRRDHPRDLLPVRPDVLHGRRAHRARDARQRLEPDETLRDRLLDQCVPRVPRRHAVLAAAARVDHVDRHARADVLDDDTVEALVRDQKVFEPPPSTRTGTPSASAARTASIASPSVVARTSER